MNDSELDRALAQLDTPDVDHWRRERIRRKAHACLDAEPPSRAALGYRRFVEPALLAAFCAAQLLWAFLATAGVLLR